LIYNQQTGWRLRCLALDGNGLAEAFRLTYPGALI
jgi:hypothetical protein